MRKFLVSVLLVFLLILSFARNNFSNSLLSDNDILLRFRHLSAQQLLDTANYWFERSADTALVCYSLLINASVDENNTEQLRCIVEAYISSAVLYGQMCDYRTAFDFLLKALHLCEQNDFDKYMSSINNNMGNIYYVFNEYDMAKSYYVKALELCRDTANTILILNNLGNIELKNRRMDSVFYYLNKSVQISKAQNNVHNHIMLNNLALFYKNKRQFDSAFYFCRLSLNETRANSQIEIEAATLSVLGTLYFETNQPDSALWYAGLSNRIAEKNNFWGIVADNYIIMSQIEEMREQNKAAISHLKKCVSLKDSIFNAGRFGEINQLQRLYEVSKTNRHIEQLVLEQRIKEYAIRIISAILIVVIAVLIIVFIQKRKLNKAYEILVEKNLEIVELQQSVPEKSLDKQRKIILTSSKHEELINKILLYMESSEAICDPKFNINRLAEAILSNRGYVSEAINAGMNKNFRSFLNGYRIREAQRLFSDVEIGKYTIETIAIRTGFKSQSAFYSAFKEITGVNPHFYLKQMQGQSNNLF